ncbi:MAG: carboxypeptidase-like regulatory domain-containing protein, partial [Verrucomicrobiae bacterium]|nr:carboxypeptidase-like regulatory domain-containing protein [Verrucomicrobiae bacterium]
MCIRDRYDISVSAKGYGRCLISQLPTDEPGIIKLAPIELKPANLKLEGMVVDTDDKPVSGARVYLSGEHQPAAVTQTDNKGTFRFKAACEGQALLTAVHYQDPVFAQGMATTEGGKTNVVIKLESRFGGRTRTVQVTGVVTDADGKPVAGADVSVIGAGAATLRTDSNGRFRTSYRVEEWMIDSGQPLYLVVRHTERNLASTVEIEEGQTNLNVQLGPGVKLMGRVKNSAGETVQEASVVLQVHFERIIHTFSQMRISKESNGSFEIAALPSDLRYSLLITARGHGTSQVEVEAEPGQSVIELEPVVLKTADRIVAGRVVDEKERPVRGARVQIVGQGQPTEETITDKDGRFQLKVCEGELEI